MSKCVCRGIGCKLCALVVLGLTLTPKIIEEATPRLSCSVREACQPDQMMPPEVREGLLQISGLMPSTSIASGPGTGTRVGSFFDANAYLDVNAYFT